jgi:hypothetical protein
VALVGEGIHFQPIAAVLLNRITTDAHLIRTLFTDPYWAVAAVGLLLALLACLRANRPSMAGWCG